MLRKFKLLLSHTYNYATDERFRRFFAHRRLKSISARSRAATSVAERLPSAPSMSEFSKPIAASLNRDGYAMTPNIVTAQQVADLRAYFTDRPVKDPYRPDSPMFCPPKEAPVGTHVAFYTNEEVAMAPHALAIANSPALLEAVGAELGAMPTVSYMAAWWSLPAQDGIAQHAENYHRDVDDYDWVKFFLYLTDVDDDSGPHLYISGSHTEEKLMQIRRYSEDEVFGAFGKEREVKFTGPAGTSFLEKTYGFHRGLPVTKTPRLILQVQYSLTPIVYGPKKPVVALPKEFDPFVNRVYCAQ
jgi:Phytanoyl-CoA dioxygenase (PhyH)